MYVRAQKGIGYLPQEPSVFRKLSVEDNIAAILELQSLSKTEAAARLEQLLDEFSLQAVRKSPGDVLSGGERRRTEIARALASNPSFILLDEPAVSTPLPWRTSNTSSISFATRHWGADHRPQQQDLHVRTGRTSCSKARF